MDVRGRFGLIVVGHGMLSRLVVRRLNTVKVCSQFCAIVGRKEEEGFGRFCIQE